jgi:hypothetical protein
MDGRPRVDDHTKTPMQEQKIVSDLHREGDFCTQQFEKDVSQLPKKPGTAGIHERRIEIVSHWGDYTVRV